MTLLMEAVKDPLNVDLENLPEPVFTDLTEAFDFAFWLIFYNSLFTLATSTILPWLEHA